MFSIGDIVVYKGKKGKVVNFRADFDADETLKVYHIIIFEDGTKGRYTSRELKLAPKIKKVFGIVAFCNKYYK